MAVWLVSSARCAVHGCDLDKASKAFSARRVWANPVFFFRKAEVVSTSGVFLWYFFMFFYWRNGLVKVLGISGNIWNHGDILCRRLCAAGVRCAGGAKEPEFLHESRYPLVNCYITMERSTIFNG